MKRKYMCFHIPKMFYEVISSSINLLFPKSGCQHGNHGGQARVGVVEAEETTLCSLINESVQTTWQNEAVDDGGGIRMSQFCEVGAKIAKDEVF